MICRCLRRDAGCLEIRMSDPDHLTGAECTDADLPSVAVDNGSRVGDDISCLLIDIVGISCIQEIVDRIHKSDPFSRDRGSQILRRPADKDKKSIGLRRDTSGHAGGKNGIDPRTSADSA